MFSFYTNQRVFDVQLESFKRHYIFDLKKYIRRLTLALHAELIKRTPIATGFARASWNVSINVPNTGTPKESTVKRNQRKGTIIQRHRSAINKKVVLADFDPLSDVIIINNSSPYILDLESGKNKQAPNGILLISIETIRGRAIIGTI